MKKWLIAIIFPFLVTVPSLTYSFDNSYDPIGTYKTGLETERYYEPDEWESDRINIKSGRETKGYIKRDKWQSDRFNFYDKIYKNQVLISNKILGNRKGTILYKTACSQINSQAGQTLKAGFSIDLAFFNF